MHIERDYIKQLKDAASGPNFTEYLRNAYCQFQNEIKDRLTFSKLAVKRAIKLTGDDRQDALDTIASGSRCWGLGEFATRILARNNAIDSASSMRACLVNQTIRNQLSGYDVASELNRKSTGRRFMDLVGARVPETYQTQTKLADLTVMEKCVVKPRSGANSCGVYLIFSADRIFSVKRSQYLRSVDELKEAMALDIKNGDVREDSWFIEELILEDSDAGIPGRDIKFFCFYGEIPLALEVTRIPKKKYCWWSAPGKIADTGKFSDAGFNGLGFSETELRAVQKISKEVPLPFVRIDFIRSEDGLVFGEFTPRQGGFEEYNEITDIELGRHFLAAEGRLLKDMLNGRIFETYNALRT